MMEEPKAFRYRPHQKQLAFHDDAYTVFYRGVFAGTGAGKTLCGLAEDIRWCRENTGIVGYVFEPTYPMVKRILLPTLERDLLLGTPIESNVLISKFNRADMCLEFKNGSRLWFGSLDDPEKSEGVNIDFAHLDEPRLMRHFDVCWNVIRRRLRGSNQNIPYPRGAWVTTTPDTPGSCLFNFFENPQTKNPLSRIYRWSIFENPELPQQYLEEMKRTHSGGYAERFLYGRFAEIAQGSFPFDSTVHVFEKPVLKSTLTSVRYGIDFGWTSPSAIIVTAYDGDDRVWVLDEFYQAQAGAERIVQEAQTLVAQYGSGPFLCDPSEPETIMKLKAGGINAQPYSHKREEGLRELGARFQKAGDGRPRIYISSRCVNLISELLEYRVDVKERDHACFVAGTMVSTKRGQVPIEQVEESDYVWTRRGLRPVITSGFTGVRDVMKVSFDDGSFLVGTPDHPVFVIGKGFTRMDALRYAYKCEILNLLSCRNIVTSKEKNKNSTEQYITAIPTAPNLTVENISEPAAGTETPDTFTEKFGNSIRAPFPKGMSFTTKTVTLLTTKLTILSASVKRHIYQAMANNSGIILSMRGSRGSIWTEFGLSQNLGMPRKKDMNGISGNGRIVSENPSSNQRNYVRSAARDSWINRRNRVESSVLAIVKPARCVSVEKCRGKHRVYNLRVEGASEFFANGILVHNCDALRYSLKLQSTAPLRAFRFG